jgi:hypothetical protein
MAEELKSSARDAVDEVKETAQESGERVRDEARDAVDTVRQTVSE